MLHSIPYNKYDDGTGSYANELFCMNNEFDKCLTSMDLSIMAQRSLTIYEGLIKIQFELNEEKIEMSSSQFEEYQTKLDNAFKYYRLLDKKLANARKIIIQAAKKNHIASFKDAVSFSHDDLIL